MIRDHKAKFKGTALSIFGCLFFLPAVIACNNTNSVLELAETNTKLANLEFRLTSLEMTSLEMMQLAHSTAIFEPSDTGYQRVDTSSGTFLVKLNSIKPYADGQRLSFDLGNPSFAAYNNVKLIVAWNVRNDGRIISSDQWTHRLQEKEFPILNTVQAGSWNPVTVIISPATAEQTGFIRVKIETTQIWLRK